MTEINQLGQLRQFKGHPGEFWAAFLAFSISQIGATASCLLSRSAQGWKPVSFHPKQHPLFDFLASATLDPLVTTCLLEEPAPHPTAAGFSLLGFKPALEGEQDFLIVYLVPNQDSPQLKAKRQYLHLLADTPAAYFQNRHCQQTEKRQQFFIELLDLLPALYTTENFLQAAMLLVNATATNQQCSQVSLGWLDQGYVKVQAISQMDRFAEKKEIVDSLAAAMEEALDQDEEILFPGSSASGALSRDHQLYAKQQQTDFLLSLPLRIAGEPVAVLTCERQEREFSLEEQVALRILVDQASPRLAELQTQSRPFFLRLKDRLQQQAARLFGAEHSLAKLCGILLLSTVIATTLIDLPYRIEAPFILRSSDVRQVSAPVNGYIDSVAVEKGQTVQQGQLLLSLDNRELQLEELAALASQLRYQREAEKARAQGSLIDMKIAQAQTDQATARLAIIRHQLQQMQIVASLEGIVVEGELRELQGLAVNKGDILLKLARLDNLFCELKIAERDVFLVNPGQSAELVFIGRPELKYTLVLKQVDPVAQADDSGNHFLANAELQAAPDNWWRPGMSGIAKIDIGERSMLWIAGHRTIDFLRMLLWW